MQHVVSFSGGVSSWMAGRLVVDRVARPGDEVLLLFADTRMESADVYAFLEAGAADLGLPITRIADGRTPWELFRDERLLGNNAKAICSRILKRELIDRWRKAHCDPADSRHHVGLDWTEINRFDRHRAAMASNGWIAVAPLIDFKVDKPAAIEQAKERGLQLPDAYKEGFGHANCSGMCVRAGIGHWTRLYRVHPDRFAEAEAKEAEIQDFLGNDYTILRDRRKAAASINLSLRQLRERLEAQDCGLDFEEEGGCGCALED